jgi:hypothetical protein
MQASRTIPIIVVIEADPVGSGLIESLSRPGGNVTGLSQLLDEQSFSERLASAISPIRHLADAPESALLRQQRCLEVATRTSHVSLVDGTRRTYRHHGRQRGAPRRTATFHHATLRVAPHRYATREPLGTARRLSCV